MTVCAVCRSPLDYSPVRLARREVCWDEVACRARVHEQREQRRQARMVKRETILRVVHSAEVTGRDIVRALDFTRQQFPGTFSDRYVDEVHDVTPYKHVSRFTVEVEHDPEFTPGDVSNIIMSYLRGADSITCLVCRHDDGGCCEFGPDPKRAA